MTLKCKTEMTVEKSVMSRLGALISLSLSVSQISTTRQLFERSQRSGCVSVRPQIFPGFLISTLLTKVCRVFGDGLSSCWDKWQPACPRASVNRDHCTIWSFPGFSRLAEHCFSSAVNFFAGVSVVPVSSCLSQQAANSASSSSFRSPILPHHHPQTRTHLHETLNLDVRKKIRKLTL